MMPTLLMWNKVFSWSSSDLGDIYHPISGQLLHLLPVRVLGSDVMVGLSYGVIF
jgi:predicted RNA-binding protein